MFYIVLAIAVGWGLWVFASQRSGFLSDFATLLDRPEFVQGLENVLARRAFLKGEFRGRKVVVFLQNGREDYSRNFVISMETGASVVMDTYDFANHRDDREGELALFALEAKHEFVLKHEEGCLKARWQPQKFTIFNFNFPSNFDLQKSQTVLEAMHTLAASIERRADAAP